MKRKLTHRLSTGLTDDEYRWVAQLAEYNHISMSALNRQRLLKGYRPKAVREQKGVKTKP